MLHADHLHLLVHGRADTANCRVFISSAKQYRYYYAESMERGYGSAGRASTRCEKDEDSLAVARYVENPAAGWSSVADYPFVGSMVRGEGVD
jgi:hypothetical protein